MRFQRLSPHDKDIVTTMVDSDETGANTTAAGQKRPGHDVVASARANVMSKMGARSFVHLVELANVLGQYAS